MVEVAIVGGGLAGMISALRLLQSGCRVSVFEASRRLGGKAGADDNGATYNDHAYHVFPAWYVNLWKLVDELGIRNHFLDCTDMLALYAGEYPNFLRFRNFASPRYAWQNLTSGFLPFPQMLLMMYASLDLASQPDRSAARLDQMSVNGFVRSRFYCTDAVATSMGEVMLKAVADPSYLVSARTVARVMRYWLKSPAPMFRIVRGNLQQFLIEPIAQAIAKRGGKIHTGVRLERLHVEGSRARHLELVDANSGTRKTIQVGHVILAIPAEQVVRLIDDEVYSAAPALSRLHQLRVNPMASLDIYFARLIPDIPKNHVQLVGSRFELSFLDIAQIWGGFEGSVLSTTACNAGDLEGLSRERATAALLDDMRQFIPALDSNGITRTVYQDHARQPLFMNDVGAWEFRPNATTQLQNLFLAGDYCRSHVDLASVEGAIVSALHAVRALAQSARLDCPAAILPIPVYPHWLLTLGRWGLMPVAAAARIWAALPGPAPRR